MLFFSIFGEPFCLYDLHDFLTCPFLWFDSDQLFCDILIQTAKFGAVIASIPIPLFFGIYCVLYAYAGNPLNSLINSCPIQNMSDKWAPYVAFIIKFIFDQPPC
jgi:hypothetical protein